MNDQEDPSFESTPCAVCKTSISTQLEGTSVFTTLHSSKSLINNKIYLSSPHTFTPFSEIICIKCYKLITIIDDFEYMLNNAKQHFLLRIINTAQSADKETNEHSSTNEIPQSLETTSHGPPSHFLLGEGDLTTDDNIIRQDSNINTDILEPILELSVHENISSPSNCETNSFASNEECSMKDSENNSLVDNSDKNIPASNQLEIKSEPMSDEDMIETEFKVDLLKDDDLTQPVVKTESIENDDVAPTNIVVSQAFTNVV